MYSYTIVVLSQDTSHVYNLLFLLNFIIKNTCIVLLLTLLFNVNKQLLVYILYYLIYLILTWQEKYYRENLWPITLSYGFNLSHPLLLYLSVFFFYSMLVYKSFIKIKLIVPTIVIGVALYLGMYWGGINNIWGFFWTNDHIELILLFLFIILATWIHSLSYKNLGILYIVSYVYIVFYTILVRFGLIFSIHSFFIKKNLVNISLLIFSVFLNFKLSFSAWVVIILPWLLLFFIFKCLLKIKFLSLFSLYQHIVVLYLTLSLYLFYYYYIIIQNNLQNISVTFSIYKDSIVNNFFNFNCKFISLLSITLNMVNTCSLYVSLVFNYTYLYFIGLLYIFIYLTLISAVKIYIR